MSVNPAPASRRLLRWTAIVAVIVALYAVLAGLLLPRVLRTQAERRLAELTGGPVRIEEVRFNPFALRATLRGFSLADPQSIPMLGWSNLVADVQIASAWRRELHLRELVLDQPWVHVHRDAGGRINLLQLLDRVQSHFPPADPPPPPSDPFPLSLALLQITNATVQWRDDATPVPFETRWTPRLLEARGLATRRDRPAGPWSLVAHGDSGERLEARGTLAITPPAAEGTLELSELPLPKHDPYAAAVSPLQLDSGRLSLTLPFRLGASSNALSATLDQARLAVRDLALTERTNGLPFAAVPILDINGLDASLATRTAAIAEVRLQGGSLQLRRTASEPSNVQGLLRPEVIDALVRDFTDWQGALESLHIEGFTIAHSDATFDPPAAALLGPMTLSLRNLSNRSNAPPAVLQWASPWSPAGTLRVEAEATVLPTRAAATLTLDDLAIDPFHPYLAQLAHLDLQRGSLTASLRATYGHGTDPEPLVQVTGHLALRDVAALDSLNATDFVRWEAVELNGLALDLEPNRVRLEELAIRQLQTSLIVSTNGRLNVLELIRETGELTRAIPDSPEPATSPSPAEATPAQDPAQDAAPDTRVADSAPSLPWPVELGALRLEGLSLVAADRFYADGFRTRIESIDGEVRALAHPYREPTAIDLTGRLDALSGFTLQGEMRLDPDAFGTDLTLTTRRADLTRFTPYAIRFAGYPITAGVLDAEVRYRVEGDQLEAENRLRLDRFTLGARTNSPDAVNLPLKLGLALLKDREGRIELDLPLSGSLSNPEFRVAPILWQAFRNAILKVATAPFAMLGSLFGSRDSLEFVEFFPGSDDIAPAQTNRLSILARALRERPALILEILPSFDPDTDRRALARRRVEQSLRTLLAAELGPDATPPPPDQLLAPEVRERLITLLHAREFGAVTPAPDPSDAAPAPPTTPAVALSADQMEQRLVETTRIEPADLQDLALRRARAVVQLLLQEPGPGTAPIEPERLQIVPDDPDNPGLGQRRVTFRLQ